MTPRARSALFLGTLLLGSGLVLAHSCASFRDYSDKEDAKIFRDGGAPCQWRARMNDTPVETRMTKYGPVCK